MPFYDPQDVHNPTTGTSPPASWGDAVRDSLAWFAGVTTYSSNSKPYCRVYRNTNQTISNSTNTAISFNAERYDIGTMWGAVPTTRVTIPTGGDGVYSIGGCVDFTAHATGARAVWLMVNATTRIVQATQIATSGTSQGLTVQCDYELAAADYVEMFVYQTSGGNLDVTSSSAYSPEMWCRWVAAG